MTIHMLAKEHILYSYLSLYLKDIMRKYLLIIFCTFSIFCSSQKINKENPFFTIRGNVGIPRTTGSMMFRDCFSGIYEANLSFDFKLSGNFFVGLGYQNGLFKNHKSFVFYKASNGSLSYNTQLIQNGGFLKLGYDKYFSENAYMNYSLNSGFMFCNYTGVVPDTSNANKPYGLTKFSTPYVQPEMSINFVVGEKQALSFSIMLSYTTLFYQFDPKAPRFNHFQDIYIKGNRYYMNWVNIGFGFNALIRGKSKSAPTG